MAKKPFRIFFDTEFIEDGKTIELLTLGAVAEDGTEFYGINTVARRERASEWVATHVIPHVDVVPDDLQGIVVRHDPFGIGVRFRDWVETLMRGAVRDHRDVEFWGYYPSYDWVVFCQMFGTMMELPPHWPKRPNDLRQFLDPQGLDWVSQPDDAVHNALLDARWVRETYLKYAMQRAVAAKPA